MTAKVTDINGYISINANPITREGVFPYRGKDIGAPDPEKIYYVYRPAEEIEDPECIESFKNLPIVDDHTMLGDAEEGLTPAEEKGIHGITGEKLEFIKGVLYSNLKIFSRKLSDLIEKGKKDLSLGYRCRYEEKAGSFAGQAYQYVQRTLRGNHLALVDQARCDVSVLDSHFAYDSLDLTIEKETTMKDDNKKTDEKKTEDEATTLEGLAKTVADLATTVKGMNDKQTAKDEAEAAEKKKSEDEAAAEEKKTADAETKKTEDGMTDAEKLAAANARIEKLEKAQDEKPAFDENDIRMKTMKEIAQRDKLANSLSNSIGTFDHSEMSLDDVAKYGVEKIGLDCADGHEISTLNGYLAAADAAPKKVANDAADKKSGGDFSFKSKMNSKA